MSSLLEIDPSDSDDEVIIDILNFPSLFLTTVDGLPSGCWTCLTDALRQNRYITNSNIYQLSPNSKQILNITV
tara:strand:+ start:220 stop:438 length:219 start_codon:yes stop_codon:yes gene_type:complete